MNPLLRLFDPVRRSDEAAPPEFRLGAQSRTWQLLVGVGAVLLVLGVILGLGGEDGHLFSSRFYFSYLIGYTFCLSIALGSWFFVMIHHITQAYWSATVRRIPEILMMSFPVLFVLGIPILLGMHDLYHWTHEDLYEVGGAHYDPILAGKQGYLNTPFFIARYVIYFAIWIYSSYKLFSNSIHQDLTGEDRSKQLRFTSGWGLLAFALTTAFVGIDLLMTLDPHWFSTMFGVYYFAGSWFVTLAAITMAVLFIQRAGKLSHVITPEHYHDLGKYMFAFTVFWTYIAFSQYMLYWYGNLPEETLWFRHRLENGWETLATFLIFGHFLFPFLALMFRAVKRMKPVLWFFTVWFFLAHYVDLYWIAMPVHDHGFHPALIDLALWLGLVALLAGLAVWRFNRHALVAYGDRYYNRSIAFENA